MIITNEVQRRRKYKRLWFQKQKAKKNGDIKAVRYYESLIDEVRKVKREPKARRKQLLKRAKHAKKRYKANVKAGVYSARGRKYYYKYLNHYRARNRKYYGSLSGKRRAHRLAYHRKWNRAHHDLILKRAIEYEKSHRDKAKRQSYVYYHTHLSKKNRIKDKE